MESTVMKQLFYISPLLVSKAFYGIMQRKESRKQSLFIPTAEARDYTYIDEAQYSKDLDLR